MGVIGTVCSDLYGNIGRITRINKCVIIILGDSSIRHNDLRKDRLKIRLYRIGNVQLASMQQLQTIYSFLIPVEFLKLGYVSNLKANVDKWLRILTLRVMFWDPSTVKSETQQEDSAGSQIHSGCWKTMRNV